MKIFLCFILLLLVAPESDFQYCHSSFSGEIRDACFEKLKEFQKK